MLAPTRELVADLNRRAREHRLDGPPAGQEVRLADGNQASVGNVIITRANNRRLRLSATDWVKNGDRWTITRIGRGADLTVRHNRSHLTVRLPGDYVRTSTTLVSASSLLGELNDPGARLFQAVQRYTDSLNVATGQLVGPQTVAELDQADQYIPDSPLNPPGRPCEPTCSRWRPKLDSTHCATYWQPPPVETSALQATWPPSSTGASRSSRLPTQVRCPGSRAFHQRCTPIPSGGPTWPSDPNWSAASPTRSKTTPAKVTPSQSGL